MLLRVQPARLPVGTEHDEIAYTAIMMTMHTWHAMVIMAWVLAGRAYFCHVYIHIYVQHLKL